ncbi:MAG: response regulator [Rhodothermales bacterium]
MTTPTPFRLLVVEDDDTDAVKIEQALRREKPLALLWRAQTLVEACSLLEEGSFEVALVKHEMPDGNSFMLLNYLEEASIALPVVVMTGFGREDVTVASMKAGACDCIRKELDHRHLESLPARLQEAVHRHRVAQQVEKRMLRQEHLNLMDMLRLRVAAIKHEINNPLAIISGNAQLLIELARVKDLDEEVTKPISDIEEASLRIAQSLEKLSNLKELITREFEKGEGDLIDQPNL